MVKRLYSNTFESSAMTMKITQDVIESYLHCRYKSYLKLAGEQGSLSDYEQFMRESRERVRLAGIKKLLLRHKEGDVLGVPRDTRSTQTRCASARGCHRGD